LGVFKREKKTKEKKVGEKKKFGNLKARRRRRKNRLALGKVVSVRKKRVPTVKST